MPKSNRFATDPAREAMIEKLMPVLTNLSAGATAVYFNLGRAIGMDVQNEGRGVLMTAIKRVEKNTGLRFATVRGTGVQRVATEDLAKIGQHARVLISRRARRARRRLTVEKLTGYNLDPDAAKAIEVERALLGAVDLVTSEETAAMFNARHVSPNPKGQFALADVLEATAALYGRK